jgi:hypothetical protein
MFKNKKFSKINGTSYGKGGSRLKRTIGKLSFLVALLLFLSTFNSNGQNIELQPLLDNAIFGAKGGFNLTDMIADPPHQIDAKLTGNIGIFSNTPIKGKFYFQPELLLSRQGGIQHTTHESTDYEYLSDEKITYLQLPLMIQYKVNENISVEGGPEIGMRLASKYKYQIVDDGVVIYENIARTEEHRKFLELGINVGATYRINDILSASLRYNYGITPINVDQTVVKLRNSVIQVSLYYTLFDFISLKSIFD